MERADIEVVTELSLGASAQREHLQLTDLVGQGLARHRNVPIDFVDDIVFRLGGVVFEKVYSLLARPPFVVDPGVDDEAHGAPHVVGELTKLRVRILVQPEVVTESLAVKAPAFDERRKSLEAPEVRHVAQLLLKRDLQVVTRHRLVHAQDFDLVDRAHLGPVQVDPVDAGAAAVRGRARVVSGGRVRGDGIGDRFYTIGHPRRSTPNSLTSSGSMRLLVAR